MKSFETCVGCGVTLYPQRAWYRKTELERESLRQQGYRAASSHGECSTCRGRAWREEASAKSRKYERIETEYPAMQTTHLEAVPDDLVHPQHLMVRHLLREVRATKTYEQAGVQTIMAETAVFDENVRGSGDRHYG